MQMNDIENSNHHSSLVGASKVSDGQERGYSFSAAFVASDRSVARASAAVASFDTGQASSGFRVGWFRNGRRWVANCLARTPGKHLPPFDLAAERSRAYPVSTPEARVHALASVRLRNGDEFVVAVDEANEAYLYACLGGSSDSARVAWFETTDRCLVGLNLAHLNAIFWSPPPSAAPGATAWDHDHLVVHFADKQAIELLRISGDDIHRLRRATISKHRATAFHTLQGRSSDLVSVSIDTMTYITMPAAWLAEDC
jgi:hypothetical protein